MKRTVVLMFLGIFIMLLSLQLSCATAKKDQGYHDSSVLSGQAQAANETSTEVKETQAAKETPVKAEETQAATETSANVEGTSTEGLLLGDKHKAAGVACSDCHAETPPATEVQTAVCLSCHEDYKERATSSIDPHNAHIKSHMFSECGDCHHSHRASENQCLGCHDFDLQVP